VLLTCGVLRVLLKYTQEGEGEDVHLSPRLLTDFYMLSGTVLIRLFTGNSPFLALQKKTALGELDFVFL
jgi:hypothetical protein